MRNLQEAGPQEASLTALSKVSHAFKHGAGQFHGVEINLWLLAMMVVHTLRMDLPTHQIYRPEYATSYVPITHVAFLALS